jgi:membrane protein
MADTPSKLHKARELIQELLDESGLRAGAKAAKWRRFIHFWVLVGSSFSRNRGPARASALAYASLLALVPMLAVAVSITSTFLKSEGEDRIDQFIVKLVATLTPAGEVNTNAVAPGSAVVTGQSDISTNLPDLSTLAQSDQAIAARKLISHEIHQFIQNTRSGALGLTGSLVLIFAAIGMLSQIETTFNDIWGAVRGRSWFMRIVLYWGVLTLAPLLLVVALGLATGAHLEGPKRMLTHLPYLGDSLLPLAFQVLPIVLLCLSFAVFYMLMPNTRVHWGAALVGGLVGGGLFHLNNAVSVLYVSRVVSNSKIYGSLALIPVLMIGLYFAWVILLFGAQVAYAFQNRASYVEERQVENINQRGREFIALRLLTLVGQRFVTGAAPPNVVELSTELAIPTRLIQQVMQTLAAARLVVEAAGPEPAYLPARPLETITCHELLMAMRATQGQELATRDEPTRGEVFGEYQRIEAAERQVAASVSLLELVQRAQGHLGPGAPKRLE